MLHDWRRRHDGHLGNERTCIWNHHGSSHPVYRDCVLDLGNVRRRTTEEEVGMGYMWLEEAGLIAETEEWKDRYGQEDTDADRERGHRKAA